MGLISCGIWFVIAGLGVAEVWGLSTDEVRMTADYYGSREVKHVCYLSCGRMFRNNALVKHFISKDLRVSVKIIENDTDDMERRLGQWYQPVGVLLDGSCDLARRALEEASKAHTMDAMHMWFVVNSDISSRLDIDVLFQHVDLSADADVVVASNFGDHYELTDVFNFGKIQGNNLEKNDVGAWRREDGLNLSQKGFKFYNRWDFHNLTLRAVSVILNRPAVFREEMLTEVRYTPGVAAMTKIAAQLLDALKEAHNFRFNYTIVDRWIGSPERNSTLAVTNSLFWREQDISVTCLRIFTHWLDWVDPFFPPTTQLQTKFYYLIPDRGVGEYENRFLTPMSPGVWWCSAGAGIVCMLVLAAAAALESRPQPALFAVCSVVAALCQQAYEDGVQLLDNVISSQGRRMTLLTVGLTSMLLYNFYTSSVVSWLLNAKAPTIATLDALIKSDLELIFEEIGYTRGWLDNPGFFYFSGLKNIKEDELREKKVIKAKRKMPLMMSVEAGIELMRTGGYAYHSEPYTASQVISRRLSDRELCELGSLQMMKPSNVYIMGQRRSPYKEFFVWSMLRLTERGHAAAVRARAGGAAAACAASSPRALALGQAAPAFALLAQAAALSAVVLAAEILWHKLHC